MTRKLAFVFPGQGAQKVGMGQDLYENYQEVKLIFEKANKILGRDIKKICFQGPDEELNKTENAQAGIFLTSVAINLLLEKQNIRPTYVAGHSLGEITACYVAGVFDLETSLELIKARGRFMANSYPGEQSAMAAVIGLDAEKTQEILASYQKYPVVLANYNSPSQIVISGQKEGVLKASEELKSAGAKRVISLKVTGAFHSPLMQKAADNFAAYLKEIPFQDSKIPVVLNRLAVMETSGTKIKENLSLQIKSPVLWTSSIKLLENRVDAFVECGPGKVLAGLIRKTIPEKEMYNIYNDASLEEQVQLMSSVTK
jgi:[acyl-carrier-protein] S-malonyltransferase